MRLLWILLAALSPACFADASDTDTDAEPLPEQRLAVDGSYALTSAIDLQAAAVAPGPVYQGITLLRGLRDQPARTLFDLADDAGVPAVGELQAALPGALESRLYGWIDDYVATALAKSPVGDAIQLVVTAADTTLGVVHLSSTLTLDGDVATHRLGEARFAALGLELGYDLSALPAPITVEARTSARVTASSSTATLTLGDQRFGLPLGTLAMRAIDDAMRARHGVDLRGALGAAVDCPRLASTVAAKCALGVCVGHEASLRSICEAGLDEVVARLRAQLAAHDLDVLRLSAGTAKLVEGAVVDGRADAIVGGVWTAAVDLGAGPRPAPATFASE